MAISKMCINLVGIWLKISSQEVALGFKKVGDPCSEWRFHSVKQIK